MDKTFHELHEYLRISACTSEFLNTRGRSSSFFDTEQNETAQIWLLLGRDTRLWFFIHPLLTLIAVAEDIILRLTWCTVSVSYKLYNTFWFRRFPPPLPKKTPLFELWLQICIVVTIGCWISKLASWISHWYQFMKVFARVYRGTFGWMVIQPNLFLLILICLISLNWINHKTKWC